MNEGTGVTLTIIDAPVSSINDPLAELPPVSGSVPLRFATAFLKGLQRPTPGKPTRNNADVVPLFFDNDRKAAGFGVELRETNGRLFEYLTSIGVGVLACRKVRNSYEVFPVQWPWRCPTDQVERNEFIERHYETFEDAGIVGPRNRRSFPKIQ